VHDLVVLPVGPLAVLHRFDGGRATPLCELGPWCEESTAWKTTLHRVSASGRRVASLFANRLVTRELLEGAVAIIDERPAPEGRIHDLRFHGERLFVAGWFELEGARTAVLEALASECTYVPLPMPEQAAWKHVDVLVSADDRLIAVDDLVRPRWLYDWSFSPPPTLGTVAELVLESPNAWVVAAARVGRHLCVLEHSAHEGGRNWAIGIFDSADLALRRGYLTVRDELGSGSKPHARTEFVCVRGNLLPANSIASDGTRLWVAAERHGIGVVDLSTLAHAGPIDESMSWSARYRTLDRRRLPSFRYHAPPPRRYVVDVATVPAHAGCFALLADSDEGLPSEFAWYSAELGLAEKLE